MLSLLVSQLKQKSHIAQKKKSDQHSNWDMPNLSMNLKYCNFTNFSALQFRWWAIMKRSV